MNSGWGRGRKSPKDGRSSSILTMHAPRRRRVTWARCTIPVLSIVCALSTVEIPTRMTPPPSPHAAKGVTYEEALASDRTLAFSRQTVALKPDPLPFSTGRRAHLYPGKP